MRIRIAFVPLALALVLSGCAGVSPAPSTPSPTTEPSSLPTSLAIPRAALDLDCDDVDPVALALLGAATSVPDSGQGYGPGWEDYPALGIALQQAGVVACAWQTPRADGGADSFRFRVVVDAVADYRAATDPAASMEDTVRDTVGDSSAIWCSSVACTFDVLVGDAWISGSVLQALGTSDLTPTVTGVLGPLTNSVAEAARQPDLWTAPPGAADGWGWDCEEPGPAAPVLEGLRAAYDGRLSSLGVQVDRRLEPQRVVDALSFCSTAAGEYEVLAAASFVVGGAWAVEEPPTWIGTGFVRVDVAGASRAAIACGTLCLGLAAVDGSLLVVQGAAEGDEEFTRRLGVVVASVRA